MKTYRCKRGIEAMRWTDTDEDRELFAAWFEQHGAVFATRGPEVTLPERGAAAAGAWILYADDEFLTMTDALFTGTYEEIP